jgi:hypothetical protein
MAVVFSVLVVQPTISTQYFFGFLIDERCWDWEATAVTGKNPRSFR